MVEELEHPLIQMIKSGKITFEKGKIIALGEMGVILPVRVMNKLLILLREKMKEKDAHELLYELGKYQIRQALKRYIKILGWSNIEKQRWMEFGFKFLTSFLGLGIFQVRSKNNALIVSINKTSFAEEFVLEYGKQQKPIDYYLCGVWEQVFTSFLGKPMACEEVKCYAKGDDCCEFIVKPKEEIETKS